MLLRTYELSADQELCPLSGYVVCLDCGGDVIPEQDITSQHDLDQARRDHRVLDCPHPEE